VRPSRYDAGIPLQERWLFPSRKSAGRSITTRHLNRLFHEAADAAGIRKHVTVHTLRHYAEFRIMPSDCRIILTGNASIDADSA
jgi:integrase